MIYDTHTKHGFSHGRLAGLRVLGGLVLLATGGEALPMRVLVHSAELLVFGDTQLHDEPHRKHDDGSAHSREGHSCQGSCNLLAQQYEAAAVDQAIIHSENACKDGTCEAAHAVQTHGVKGVVHKDHLIQHRHGHVAPGCAQKAYGNAPARGDEAGGWSDADQPCHCTNGCSHTAGLSLQDPLHEQPSHHGAGGRNQRGGHGPCGHAVSDAQRRATVEAQPTKPEKAGTKDHEGDIRGAQLLVHVAARAHNGSGNVAGDPRADVHHLGKTEEKTK